MANIKYLFYFAVVFLYFYKYIMPGFIKVFQISVIVLASHVLVLGQLNIKVGYITGRTEAPGYNDIVDHFNSNIESVYILDDALDPLRWMHGLELGVRYKIRNVGFELSWSGLQKRADVFASLNNVNRLQSRLFTGLTEYSLSAENYYGFFGYGASIGYRYLTIKTDVPGSRRRRSELLGEDGWAGKLYLIFSLPGDNVALAFKPYIQFPLTEYAMDGFENGINDKFDFPQRDFVEPERFFMYGISVVLYNGRQ